VSWIETIILLYTIYNLGKILNMDTNTSLVVSSGLAICGSSAAMTISECVNADSSITMIFIAIMSILTIPQIPLLPFADKLIMKIITINNETEGAWIGGSIDSTGAVVATSSLAGVDIVKSAIVIKMLQNILIAPIALFVTIKWTSEYKLIILWKKFPKFVLGFMLVAIITTSLPILLSELVSANSFILSEWFSGLSFILIGYEIDITKIFTDLFINKKILLLYIIGQSFDLFTTFMVSYLCFQVWS
jgi:uncharacterized membrane protein YadS